VIVRFIFTMALLFAVTAVARGQLSDWTAEYTRLLASYVTPAGVKYAEWEDNATDRQALEQVVDASRTRMSIRWARRTSSPST